MTWAMATPIRTPLTVYCLHHAGGRESMFRDWSCWAPRWLRFRGVPLHKAVECQTIASERSFRGALETCLDFIRSDVHGEYALFGYSMGGLLAIEAASELTTVWGQPPMTITVAAAAPPERQPDWRKLMSQTDDELFEFLSTQAGLEGHDIPVPELREYAIAAFRQDLVLLATREYRPPRRVSCPIGVLLGNRDPLVPLSAAELWRDYTSGPVTIQVVPGDHGFPRRYGRETLGRVVQHIEAAASLREIVPKLATNPTSGSTDTVPIVADDKPRAMRAVKAW